MTDRGVAQSVRNGRPRILVVRRRYLGDTVLIQPLLRNLRAHWPEAWITVAVDTPYMGTLAACPDLDEIVEVPVGPLGIAAQAARWVRAVRSLGGRPYHLAIDLARNERALVLLLLSRARRIATLQIGNGARRSWPYTDVVSLTREEADGMHTVDMHRRLLSAIGVPAPFRVPELPVRAEDREAARALLAQAGVVRPSGRPVLLLHPGSGSEARRWPPSGFARVADYAVRVSDAQVAVLSGPSEPELGRAVVAAMSGPAMLLTGVPTVGTLFGLVAEVDLLLCNDSGPMHMAAAVGTPVCALFGSQSRATWAPLGAAPHVTFQAALPCGERCVAPEACEPTDPMRSFCVRRIDPDEVAHAVAEGLGRALPSTHPTGESRDRSA